MQPGRWIPRDGANVYFHPRDKTGALLPNQRVSPVFVPVGGDDVVAGVLQLVAHEAPGERVRLRVSL